IRRYIRVRAEHSLPHCGKKRTGISRGFYDQSHIRKRRLCKREIHRGGCGRAGTAVADIRQQADHLTRNAKYVDALSDRVLVREVTARELFIDHGNHWMMRVVCCREETASDQAGVRHLQVVGVCGLELGFVLLALGWDGPTDDGDSRCPGRAIRTV